MTDRPILFSSPMIRAVLREIEKPGTGKTQTRRVFKLPTKTFSGGPIYERPDMGGWAATTIGGRGCFIINHSGERIPEPERLALWHQTTGVCIAAPYTTGDRLWVRESLERANGGEAVGYPADLTWLPNTPWEWQRSRLPSIHMPRRLSRITLTVTDVRLQRLQEISDVDALAEGILTLNRVGYLNGGPLYGLDEGIGHDTPVGAFNHLWRSINGDGSWAANPWVVAITFRPILANIDSVEARAA